MGMDVYGKTKDSYFRANIWSWRPIRQMIDDANERFELGIEPDTLTGMDYNSGDGLKTQEKCNALADAMDKMLDELNVESISVNLGSRVDENNKFLPENSTEGVSAHSATIEHCHEFTKFLRECGGSFEVW